ncbi:MAG: ABC transporter permease, partial [Raoultibacter sp.]
LVLGYVNQFKNEGGRVIEKPLEEASTKMTLEVGALVDQVPPSINASGASNRFPVLILPESVAASEAGVMSPSGDTGAFDYYWMNISFRAENHVEAAASLEGLTAQSKLIGFSVHDIAESAREGRLVSQAIQLFIFCFSVIMLLIAVANVFNTLTNSIILRTKEFAMLKSAGMGDRAFARMLLYECASYAFRGLAIGLVVATVVTYLFYRAINLSFAGIAFNLPWAHVGVAVMIVLIILALSVVFALRKSHASSVVDALRADVV